MRTIVDVVPNHVSDQHDWFREALASPPGSPSRERFWFRPGSGPDGASAPNGWQSIFGGSAWTRVGGRRVVSALVRARAARSQLDPSRRLGRARGDPPLLVRPRCRRRPRRLGRPPGEGPRASRARARERRTDAIRSWIATSSTTSIAAGARSRTATPSHACWSARCGSPTPGVSCGTLRPDEMHTAFNFDFLSCPWEPARLRESIESTLALHAPVDAPPTWVLSNHDVTRPVTRYGRADTSFSFESKREGTPTDLTARNPQGPRRRLARHGASGLPLRVPGRGARPPRGRGHPARPPSGSDVAPLRWPRPGPGRVPDPDPLGGRLPAVRLQQRRRDTVARPTRRMGRS